jgi:uncharacterized protein YkwD
MQQFMRGLRSQRDNVPDLDRFGFRPLINPTNLPQLDQHSRSHHQRPTSSSSSSSAGKRAVAAQDNNEFARDALQVHNELRRRHGVEPLRLNSDLSRLAQQWGKYRK